MAAGTLAHPAAVRRTVTTVFFLFLLLAWEGWETLDALVSVCFREASLYIYIQIDHLLRTTMFGTEGRSSIHTDTGPVAEDISSLLLFERLFSATAKNKNKTERTKR